MSTNYLTEIRKVFTLLSATYRTVQVAGHTRDAKEQARNDCLIARIHLDNAISALTEELKQKG